MVVPQALPVDLRGRRWWWALGAPSSRRLRGQARPFLGPAACCRPVCSGQAMRLAGVAGDPPEWRGAHGRVLRAPLLRASAQLGRTGWPPCGRPLTHGYQQDMDPWHECHEIVRVGPRWAHRRCGLETGPGGQGVPGRAPSARCRLSRGPWIGSAGASSRAALPGPGGVWGRSALWPPAGEMCRGAPCMSAVGGKYGALGRWSGRAWPLGKFPGGGRHFAAHREGGLYAGSRFARRRAPCAISSVVPRAAGCPCAPWQVPRRVGACGGTSPLLRVGPGPPSCPRVLRWSGAVCRSGGVGRGGSGRLPRRAVTAELRCMREPRTSVTVLLLHIVSALDCSDTKHRQGEISLLLPTSDCGNEHIPPLPLLGSGPTPTSPNIKRALLCRQVLFSGSILLSRLRHNRSRTPKSAMKATGALDVVRLSLRARSKTHPTFPTPSPLTLDLVNACRIGLGPGPGSSPCKANMPPCRSSSVASMPFSSAPSPSDPWSTVSAENMAVVRPGGPRGTAAAHGENVTRSKTGTAVAWHGEDDMHHV